MENIVESRSKVLQQYEIGCNVVVRGVDNELLCVNKADYMFYYLEGSKVPNSSNGHILEERRKWIKTHKIK